MLSLLWCFLEFAHDFIHEGLRSVLTKYNYINITRGSASQPGTSQQVYCHLNKYSLEEEKKHRNEQSVKMNKG